jgi:hypothetical protein
MEVEVDSEGRPPLEEAAGTPSCTTDSLLNNCRIAKVEEMDLAPSEMVSASQSDDSLSAEGLASKGFVIIDEVGDERDSDEGTAALLNTCEIPREIEMWSALSEVVPASLQDGTLSAEGLASEEFVVINEDGEERSSDEGSAVLLDKSEIPKVKEMDSAVLTDGTLSAEGLASKGYVFTDEEDDEEDDEEEDERDSDEGSGALLDKFEFPEEKEMDAGLPEMVSAMLKDGTLSAEGLASKGYVFMDKDEEGRDSDDGSAEAESLDDEDDSDSDSVSSSGGSVEEDAKESKSKANGKKKDELEDTGPPRTKHEIDVSFPPFASSRLL